MKTNLILLFILFYCVACHNKSNKVKNVTNFEKISNLHPLSDPTDLKKTTNDVNLSLQKINFQNKQRDTVLFKEQNDDGDYFLFIVTQGKQEMTLIYNGNILNGKNFLRGDKIIIEWELDSIKNAGDDEVLDYVKRIRKVKKIEDGKLSLYRKEHNKPIEYVSNKEVDNYSQHFINQVHNIVEYVVANSKAETLQRVLETPNSTLFYSISEIEKANRMYYLYHISSKMDGQLKDCLLYTSDAADE